VLEITRLSHKGRRTQLLGDLMRDGIEIAACSSFLAELLHLDD
jgi:hypothetical protein